MTKYCHYCGASEGEWHSRECANLRLKEAKPMVKMVVRDEKREPEKVIEWWLEQDGAGIGLKARMMGGKDVYVAVIGADGILPLFGGCPDGVRAGEHGRIRIITR